MKRIHHLSIIFILMLLITLIFTQKSYSSGYTCNNVTFGDSCNESKEALAFPGAEGFGAVDRNGNVTTTGGRGGRLYIVSNTNDSGDGSLRKCIEESGPRICVIQTAGTIKLASPLIIDNEDITIAGQSAPGYGIVLSNDITKNNFSSPLVIRANNTIVRYITIRANPGRKGQDSSGHSLDGLLITKGDNNLLRYVIVDHVSITWSTDEVLNVWDHVQNLSIQWSNLSEGVHDSTHEKGAHSRGPLIGTKASSNDQSIATGDISYHKNLMAHNLTRSPRVSTNKSTNSPLMMNIVNNVAFNCNRCIQTTDAQGLPYVNIVGNYVNRSSDYAIEINTHDNGGPGFAEVFLNGNISPNRSSNNDAEYSDTGLRDNANLSKINGSSKYLSSSPVGPILVEPINAITAKDAVLTCVGDSLKTSSSGNLQLTRNVTDTRLSDEVKNTSDGASYQSSKLVDHPDQVGGFPNHSNFTPYADTDKDGMPDSWELDHFGSTSISGLDNGYTTQDSDEDGFTDLEEYLNDTDPMSAESGCNGSTITPRIRPTATPTPAEQTNISSSFLRNYGTTNSNYDYNHDGRVNFGDI